MEPLEKALEDRYSLAKSALAGGHGDDHEGGEADQGQLADSLLALQTRQTRIRAGQRALGQAITVL